MSKERQDRRLQKDRVAAQVTFVIWMMEFLFSASDLISGFIFGAFGNPIMRTMNMMLHLVFLPYAYLMNTSANKKRIVDEGWLNVLKNIFGCSCGVFRNRSSETRVYVFSSGNTKTNPKDKNVFVISQKVHEQEQSKGNCSLPNMPTETGNQQDQKKTNADTENYELQNMSAAPQTYSSVNERTSIEVEPAQGTSNSITEHKSLRQVMGEKILRDMILNIDDEDLYIGQFQLLLNLEDYFKTQSDSSDLLYLYNNNDEVHDDEQTTKANISNGAQRKTESVQKCYKPIPNYPLFQYLGIPINDNSGAKPVMIGQISERTVQRTELLNNLTLCSDDEETYVQFVELITDLEESFT